MAEPRGMNYRENKLRYECNRWRYILRILYNRGLYGLCAFKSQTFDISNMEYYIPAETFLVKLVRRVTRRRTQTLLLIAVVLSHQLIQIRNLSLPPKKGSRLCLKILRRNVCLRIPIWRNVDGLFTPSKYIDCSWLRPPVLMSADLAILLLR